MLISDILKWYRSRKWYVKLLLVVVLIVLIVTFLIFAVVIGLGLLSLLQKKEKISGEVPEKIPVIEENVPTSEIEKELFKINTLPTETKFKYADIILVYCYSIIQFLKDRLKLPDDNENKTQFPNGRYETIKDNDELKQYSEHGGYAVLDINESFRRLFSMYLYEVGITDVQSYFIKLKDDMENTINESKINDFTVRALVPRVFPTYGAELLADINRLYITINTMPERSARIVKYIDDNFSKVRPFIENFKNDKLHGLFFSPLAKAVNPANPV